MTDEHFLKLALIQAKVHKGFCYPNPAVGALIVKNNTILAEGYHKGPGSAHAEIEALNKIDFKVPLDATLYVTLEPCCHWGRTPPCVDAIIKSGIKRVVYGYIDPNLIVSGKGAAILTSAGIQCEYIEDAEINEFYRSYAHWHLTGQPFVTAKIALSLNGAIAASDGTPVQITGEELRQFTHESRKSADAILTTVKTVIQDNPQLNVRLNNNVLAKPMYLLDASLKIPLNAKLFQTAKSITLFHGRNVDKQKYQQLTNKGIRCIEITETTHGLNLQQVIHVIGQDGIHDLWVEAGGQCFASFVNDKLLQRAYIYISLCWIKHGKIAFPMGISLHEMSQNISWRQFGRDVLCDIRF